MSAKVRIAANSIRKFANGWKNCLIRHEQIWVTREPEAPAHARWARYPKMRDCEFLSSPDQAQKTGLDRCQAVCYDFESSFCLVIDVAVQRAGIGSLEILCQVGGIYGSDDHSVHVRMR